MSNASIRPRVSIIIPSYNRAEFIPATLDSILVQTYKDFEIIFVDDGSTDSTAEILNQYSQRDSRIQYIKQNNSERAVARTRGMKAARGDYLALVDSDDIWYPEKLAKQVVILENDSSCVLCYAAVGRIDLAGKHLPSALRQRQGASGLVYFDLLMRNFIPSVTPLFRREAFEQVAEQRTEFIPYEDWDFWLRLSLLGKFFHIQEPLGDYRLHPGQSVKNTKAEHIQKVTLGVLEANTNIENPALKNYLSQNKITDSEFLQIRNRAFSEAHLRLGYWYIVGGDLQTAKSHLDESYRLSTKIFDYRFHALKAALSLSSVAPNQVREFLGAFH